MTAASLAGRAIRRFPLSHSWPQLAIAAIAAATILLDRRPFHLMLPPDLVSYLLVAQKVAGGHLADSVSSYWGPLYSWLLALVHVITGLAWERVPRVGNAITIIVAVSGAMALGQALALPRPAVVLGGVTAAVFVYGAAVLAGIDILFTGLFLWALVFICRLWDVPQARTGTWLGVVLGLLYLTKSFGLPLAVAMLLVTGAVAWLQGRSEPGFDRAGVTRALVRAGIVMLVVSLPWIAIISIKMGYPTFGTSGKFNHLLFGPGVADFPMHTQGLIPLPAPWAVSAWHDPTRLVLPAWSPFASVADLTFLVKRFVGNIVMAFRLLYWGAVATVLVMTVAVLSARENPLARFGAKTAIVIACSLVYVAGYAVVTVEERYLYGAALALWIACLSMAFKVWREGAILWVVLVVVAVLNVWPRIKSYAQLTPSPATAELARELASVIPAGARIASTGDWSETLGLSYRNGYQYHGEKGRASDRRFAEQITAQRIQYLLVTDGSPSPPADVVQRADVVHKSRLKGLIIYRMGR